ncbi:MAG: sulfotransferase family protein [Gammaproteobacteria bacterium]
MHIPQDPLPPGSSQDKTFIFVVGLHRSGTSLLYRLVGAHPEVSCFAGTGVSRDEGQHLQSVIPTANVFGGIGRFGFDPRSHLDENSPLATAENAARIYSEWGRYWDLGKRFLIEKSPPTLLRMRFFQALFPNSVFVVILRHPIALAVATRKEFRYAIRHGVGGKNSTSIERAVQELGKGRMRPNLEHPLLCYERAITDLAHIKRAFVLRYEDFVASPDDALSEIFAFLGLPPVSAAEPVRADVNASSFDSWRHGPLAALRKRLARRHEARAQRIGYSLIEPQTRVPLRLPGLPSGIAILSQ